jgi:formiminotetrahydrofolate cyclodeaminase
MNTAEHTIGSWLETLASDDPTPGGGAFAAVAAAAGAGMIAMVGRLTVGRKGFQDLDDRMRDMVSTADAARERFLAMADADASSFTAVMQAFRMPKETDADKEARTAAIQEAYAGAADVPLAVARAAVELMELAEDATAMGNPNAASDGFSAAASLHGAALSAIANVEINAAGLKDEATRAGYVAEGARQRARADELLRDAQTAFELRLSS